MVEDFLSRLDKVKQTNGGYSARCPAHDDRVNSLSIAEDNDKILLKCHAGCDVTEVMEALDLSVKDLFIEEPPKPAKITDTYDYVDWDNGLLYQAVRLIPKDFKQRRPDGNGGWIWNLKNTQRVLYRLPEVIEQVVKGGYVFYVEGEKDADRLRTEGFTATTNCGGAEAFRADYADTLKNANLVILPDNDEPGRRMAHKIKAQLNGDARAVRIIELPGLPEHGDVSDWLNGKGTAQRLKELVASPPRPKDVVNLVDALKFVEKYTKEPLPRGLEWPWKRVNTLTRGLRGGWLIYLAGRPTFGKTAAAISLAVHSAKRDIRVLLVSLEMSSEEIAVRVAQHSGLDTWRFYGGSPNVHDKEAARIAMQNPAHKNIEVGFATTPERIDEITDQMEPGLLIVDYLQLMDIGRDSRTEGTTKNSHALKFIARKYDIPVVCLSQLRRRSSSDSGAGVPGLQDLRDSGALEQDADQTIFVHREEDTDKNPKPEGAFLVSKARMGETGREDFVFDGHLQYFDCSGGRLAT